MLCHQAAIRRCNQRGHRLDRAGYYLVAIGEDEDAAEAVGIDAPRVKRSIYMLSAFLTALAGTINTQYIIYFIDPRCEWHSLRRIACDSYAKRPLRPRKLALSGNTVDASARSSTRR